MKNSIAAIICASVFGVAAFAQTMPALREQSGSMPSVQSQPSASYSSTAANSGNQNSATIGEKRLKGCLVSEGGKYMLQEKRGKEIALAGSQEMGSHVGHTVMAHGTFTNGDVNHRTTATYNATSAG